MSSRITHLITTADVFGQGIEFKINNEYRSKTFFGGTLSILLGFLVTCMFMYSSQDLFYKTNPQVIIEERVLSQPPKIIMNKTTMPFAISIFNGLSPIYKPEYFKFSASVYSGSIKQNMTESKFEFTKCTKEFFPMVSRENYDKLLIQNSLCIENMNITIYGSWVEPEISYFLVSLDLCVNQVEQDSCAPLSEIKNYVNSNFLFFNVFYMHTVINPQNASEPVIYSMKTNYNRVNLNTTKSSTIFIKEQSLISDEGFLLKQYNFNNSIAWDDIYYDDYEDFSNNLIKVYLYSSQSKIIYNRIYLKIQSVLAEVGGIANILRITFSTCCYFFSLVRRDETILNRIFEYDLIGSNNEDKKLEFKRRTTNIININTQSKEKNMDKDIPNYNIVPCESNQSANNSPIKLDKSNVRTARKSYTMNNKCNELYNKEHFPQLKNEFNFNDAKTDDLVKINAEKQNNLSDAKQIISILNSRDGLYRLTFSFLEIWRAFICCKLCMSPFIKSKRALYDKSIFAIDEFLDVSNMVQKFEELEKLKIVLLNSEQLALFNFIAKEFMSLDEEKDNNNYMNKYKKLTKNKEQLANIIINLKNKMKNNIEVLEIDQKLFSLLNEEFK